MDGFQKAFKGENGSVITEQRVPGKSKVESVPGPTDSKLVPPSGSIVTEKRVPGRTEEVNIPRGEKAEIVPPTSGTSNAISKGGESSSNRDDIPTGGWVKNSETGNWEQIGVTKGTQGAITSQGPFSSKNSLEGFRKGVESLNKNSEVSRSSSEDKYAVLDGDNPFDFPKIEDRNVSIKGETEDTANEPIIKKEHYEPLYGEPPSREELQFRNKMEKLLQEQYEISNKAKLSAKDKKRLAEIEKEMRGLIDSRNRPELPPVDYDEVDTRPELPPVDYDEVDTRPELPPVDYDEVDTRPELPPVDYDEVDTRPVLQQSSQNRGKKPKKNVSFSDKVEVKYIDNDSSSLIKGGSEKLKDKE